MPFIRYNIEDIGIPSPDTCSCGRTQPLIQRIEGRVADFLVTPGGKMISGISLTDHFGGNIAGIEQIQIIQDKVDHLLINIVKDDDFSKQSIEQIEKLVIEFFGDTMHFNCVFLEDIPKEPSGKFRFTICKVSHEHTQQ
jgi:phenylacetate-CoA ligase